jgi:hypothetical protein
MARSTIFQHASTAWYLAGTIFKGHASPWSTPVTSKTHKRRPRIFDAGKDNMLL